MPINLLFQLRTTISGVSDVSTLASYLFIAIQCGMYTNLGHFAKLFQLSCDVMARSKACSINLEKNINLYV